MFDPPNTLSSFFLSTKVMYDFFANISLLIGRISLLQHIFMTLTYCECFNNHIKRTKTIIKMFCSCCELNWTNFMKITISELNNFYMISFIESNDSFSLFVSVVKLVLEHNWHCLLQTLFICESTFSECWWN